MTDRNIKHYLKEFPPIICPICGGEAYLDIELYWEEGYTIAVKCELCSNKESIDIDICDYCPNKCEDDLMNSEAKSNLEAALKLLASAAQSAGVSFEELRALLIDIQDDLTLEDKDKED